MVTYLSTRTDKKQVDSTPKHLLCGKCDGHRPHNLGGVCRRASDAPGDHAVVQTQTPIALVKTKKPKKPPTLINAFQYRIYPTPTQAAKLGHLLNTHCNLYNDALRERTAEYALTKRSLKFIDQRPMVPGRIRSGDVGVNQDSMVYTLRRIDAAIDGFVKRVVKWRAAGSPEGVELGYPQSVDLTDFKSLIWKIGSGSKWIPERQRIRITPDVGEIKAVVHRPHKGTIKTITVTHRDRRWFATLTCDLGAIPPHRTGRIIGVDLGVSKLASTDDGRFVENPRLFQKSEARLASAQRVMARRKVIPPKVPDRPEINPATGEKWPRYSQNYRDARDAAANIQRDTANRRRDYIRKAVLGLLQTRDGLPDPVGILVLEDLAIKAMITATNEKMAREEKARKEAEANGGVVPVVVPVVVPDARGRRPRRGMAKALHDAAMGGVHLALTQLAARLGVRVILVNPANTSQRCSECGDLPAVKKTLDVREHKCIACGYTAHRDTNAARNILALGQEVLRQEEADRPGKEAARLRMEAALLRKEARELRMGVADPDAAADTGKPDAEDGDHKDLSLPMQLTGPIPATIEGCIEQGPAREFANYCREANLQDPEEILADPSSYRHPERGDLVYATMNSVMLVTKGNLTEPRWRAAWEFLGILHDRHRAADIALVGAWFLVPLRTAGTTLMPLVRQMVLIGTHAARKERVKQLVLI